jgi:hypothetical protein
MSNSKFMVGSTVWYYDDFMWGLLPCTVDRPFHCRCGDEGGCTFGAHFSEDDIGRFVFESAEEAIKILGIKRPAWLKDPMLNVYEDALKKANEELDYAVYMSECAPNAGLRTIYSNKLMWLRWVVMLAEQGLEQEKNK